MNQLQFDRRSLLLAALGASAWPLALAQSGRPLRIVVPFTPGGSTDILARALAPKMQQALGVNVVVDNKPGAGGSLGATDASKAVADGTTGGRQGRQRQARLSPAGAKR